MFFNFMKRKHINMSMLQLGFDDCLTLQTFQLIDELLQLIGTLCFLPIVAKHSTREISHFSLTRHSTQTIRLICYSTNLKSVSIRIRCIIHRRTKNHRSIQLLAHYLAKQFGFTHTREVLQRINEKCITGQFVGTNI